MIYTTVHRKLKFEQHEPHLKPRVNSGAPVRADSYCSTSGARRNTLIQNSNSNYKPDEKS